MSPGQQFFFKIKLLLLLGSLLLVLVGLGVVFHVTHHLGKEANLREVLNMGLEVGIVLQVTSRVVGTACGLNVTAPSGCGVVTKIDSGIECGG